MWVFDWLEESGSRVYLHARFTISHIHRLKSLTTDAKTLPAQTVHKVTPTGSNPWRLVLLVASKRKRGPRGQVASCCIPMQITQAHRQGVRWEPEHVERCRLPPSSLKGVVHVPSMILGFVVQYIPSLSVRYVFPLNTYYVCVLICGKNNPMCTTLQTHRSTAARNELSRASVMLWAICGHGVCK